jgi:predicted small integral membrane protein
MAVRHLKIVFVTFVALLCLIYATQNVINLEACYQAFAYVASGADHAAYAGSIFPTIASPGLIWLMLAIVVALEFAAGLLAARGAWDLWSARREPAAGFNGAKTYALLGCGVGIVVWLGLFGVFGGALFQMWQTEIGGNSMDDAFQFFVSCALIFLITNAADE